MSKTRNNKICNHNSSNCNHKIKIKGKNLEQKYSLESISYDNELAGFKHSNIVIGFLGIGVLLYNMIYVKKQINDNKEVLFI